MDKRILVDMSLTVLHHGHIRLLKKASELGYVIVGLCSDEEIFKAKGFKPLLSYEQRKEIALSIKYVREVIESEYLIDEAYLDVTNSEYCEGDPARMALQIRKKIPIIDLYSNF